MFNIELALRAQQTCGAPALAHVIRHLRGLNKLTNDTKHTFGDTGDAGCDDVGPLEYKHNGCVLVTLVIQIFLKMRMAARSNPATRTWRWKVMLKIPVVRAMIPILTSAMAT